MRKKIAIILLLIVALSGCDNVEYDNPDDCTSSFESHTSTQQMAQRIYASPNCYEWGSRDGAYYIKCCHDEGVEYE